jgi:hypothetical protein
MPFGNSVECACKICNEKFLHAKKLSDHIKKTHRMSSIDYVVKYNHDNIRPMCVNCGQETRFVSLTGGFKKYCIVDSNLAESKSGRKGGSLKKTWNKGLTKTSDVRIAAMAVNSLGEGNSFFGKHHNKEMLKKMTVMKRLTHDEIVERIKETKVVLHSTYEDYEDQNTPLDISCPTCGTHDKVSLFNLKRCWSCKTCFPTASKPQIEVADFVKSLGFTDVEISTRKVIAPLELDVWVPSKKLAIEYHGLYWHSGGKSGVFEKTKHRKKYEVCRDNGIRLIQFFSDEWINKGDICRSIIANALGTNSIKLHARDCKVIPITQPESRAFVDANHISGSTRAKHHLGLFHKKLGLVGVATTRTPIQKKHGHVMELARMCFLKGVSIRGGASKLLIDVKALAVVDGFEGLLSYAELRYGTGGVYEKCGFTLVNEALNNYWYCDGERRYDRFKFRAQPGKTENQVTAEAGVRAVYGSGNKIFLWKHTKKIDLFPTGSQAISP